LTVEAIYENGVLKPRQPLPLEEHETVWITIKPRLNWAERTWDYSNRRAIPKLRRIAEDDEFGMMARCRCRRGPKGPRFSAASAASAARCLNLSRSNDLHRRRKTRVLRRASALLRRQPVSTCRSHRF
jgi:predicted DNA-binding antitoxin AbrB/MazE fold protein